MGKECTLTKVSELEDHIADLEETKDDLEADNEDLKDQVRELEKLVPDPMVGEEVIMSYEELESKVAELIDALERQGCEGRVRKLVDDIQLLQRLKWNRHYCDVVRAQAYKDGSAKRM